jgi:hypothetical protein
MKFHIKPRAYIHLKFFQLKLNESMNVNKIALIKQILSSKQFPDVNKIQKYEYLLYLDVSLLFRTLKQLIPSGKPMKSPKWALNFVTDVLVVKHVKKSTQV